MRLEICLVIHPRVGCFGGISPVRVEHAQFEEELGVGPPKQKEQNGWLAKGLKLPICPRSLQNRLSNA